VTTLRPYQAKDLGRIAEAFAAGARRVLYVLPTGGGKTTMFSEAAVNEPGLVGIVAHRRELIRQAVNRIPGATTYPSATPGRITVGSVQTLRRRLETLPRFKLIVIDEAHHAVAGDYVKLTESQPDARQLLVTATPERLDGRGLGAICDVMIVGPSVEELIAWGYLSRVEVFGPPAPPDVRALHTLAGDFSPRDLAALMDRPKIVGDAVEHYGWHAPGQPAVVFCVSVKAAHNAAEAFRAKGWRAVAVSGETPEHERDAVLRASGKLETGEVELVCSCSLIDEGLDIPNISCVIDLAPTKSLTKAMQRWGRGMRPAPGKDCLTLLDHAGNVGTRHGMPDMAREWSLDGASKRDSGAPATRQCLECFAIHRPMPTCPYCGFDYEVAKAAAARREAERVEGELARMSPDDRRLLHLRTAPLAELLKGATFEAVDEIRRARGYQPGWTMKQMSFRPSAARRENTEGREFL
jgi:superfamily II DNA or RNA helicase